MTPTGETMWEGNGSTLSRLVHSYELQIKVNGATVTITRITKELYQYNKVLRKLLAPRGRE
jgi:hypothetical protein